MILIYNVKDDSHCKMSTAEVMTMSIAGVQFFMGIFVEQGSIIMTEKHIHHTS